MMCFDQQGTELLTLPCATTDGEGPKRNAVIALVSCDNVPPVQLAPLDEILTRELKRGLHGLRSAADVEDVTDSLWSVRHEIIGQVLRNLRREEASVSVRKRVELLMHSRKYVRMRMPKTRHRRAGGSV